MLALALCPILLTSCQPAPTGTILYSGSNGSNGWDLYTVNADGSGLVRLTRDPSFIEQWPSWSPDGSRIVFRGGNPLDPSTWELYTMAATGGPKTRITSNGAADNSPHWSPDGSRIVFFSNRNDTNPDCTFDPCNWDVFTLELATGTVTQLTSDPTFDGFAKFSPDGDEIAFTSDRAGPSGIYIMNADGTDVRLVTPLSENAGYPDWSPDGTELAYSDNVCSSCAAGDLRLINTDGTDGRQLTETTSVDEINPAWSPDGAFIVFQHYTSDSEIYRVRSDGTDAENLTDAPSTLQIEPDWKA